MKAIRGIDTDSYMNILFKGYKVIIAFKIKQCQ